ncbi:MAG TPA: sulfurtransferase [Marmoricola sp.]|jgi:thiosulfate/3-mercaptopyruvate sulfurtransferase|nr:sulfurtransferase [Marmoricola sp.]
MRSPLVSAAELADLLVLTGVDRPVVLDVRYRMDGPGGLEEYGKGHVPGAAYVDMDTALAAPPGPRGRHPLPETAVFEAAMRAAGVGDDRPVVVYDDWGGRAAARAWWLLRYHGHRHVRLLDGGWPAWVRTGAAVETATPAVEPGSFTADPGHLRVVDVDEVLAFAADHTLVDARAPERYRGEVEPVDPVAGHVPGAVNVPTGRNLRDDDTFRSADELREIYAPAGDSQVAVYCGSGVTATQNIVAMAIAGIDAALYPGSWSEWVADPGRPVETG